MLLCTLPMLRSTYGPCRCAKEPCTKTTSMAGSLPAGTKASGLPSMLATARKLATKKNLRHLQRHGTMALPAWSFYRLEIAVKHVNNTANTEFSIVQVLCVADGASALALATDAAASQQVWNQTRMLVLAVTSLAHRQESPVNQVLFWMQFCVVFLMSIPHICLFTPGLFSWGGLPF